MRRRRLKQHEAVRQSAERARERVELEIKREKGGEIDGWKPEDFLIKGYNPHKTIAMEMSV